MTASEDNSTTNRTGPPPETTRAFYNKLLTAIGGVVMLIGIAYILDAPLATVLFIAAGVFIIPYTRSRFLETSDESIPSVWTTFFVVLLVAAGVAALPGWQVSSDGTATNTAGIDATATPTPTTEKAPSAYEIKGWLEEKGLVILDISEEGGELNIITEMQYTKEQDRRRIALVAEVYARAVSEGYSKKVHGAVMTVDASEQAQYAIFKSDAKKYNQGKISFEEYLWQIMSHYCCR